MNRRRTTHSRRAWGRRAGRRGAATLEEVLLLAVMVPLVFGAFVLAQKMCVYAHGIISTLVGWPLL